MPVEVHEALIGLFVAAIVLGEAVILKVALPWFKARTTREQRELAYGIVVSAVGYAEKVGLIEGLTGSQKYRKAEGWIHRRFEQLGIEFDSEEVRGWIEDVLNDMDIERQTVIARQMAVNLENETEDRTDG